MRFVALRTTSGTLGAAQITRPSRCTTSAALVPTSLGTEPAAGKPAPVVASQAAATEVEVPQTARVVAAVAEAVAVLLVVDEVASEAHAEAAEEGDHSEVVKVLPQHQQEASHKHCLTAPPHPHRL